MSRIRTIKPEFWISEQVAELSTTARLLFIGMWNFCDDQGVHPASYKSLKMEIFPGDDLTATDIARLVGELVKQKLVLEYEAQGKQYWLVTGWHHQKIDKPNKKYPLPPAGFTPKFDDHSANGSRTVDDHLPEEGKVREGIVVESTTLVESDASTAGANGQKPKTFKPDSAAVIAYLNEKTGRNFRPEAKGNITPIAARFKENYTLDDFRAVIDFKVKAWLHDPERSEYLRPETLFCAKHFDGYLNAARSTASTTAKPVLNGQTTTTDNPYKKWRTYGS